MNIRPKVSVIIPVYNTGEYIRRCLDSITNQSLKDIEIVCVNDGSTDSSLAIINEYAERDSRIKVLSQSNQGLGGARNTGLNAASGEYISFIDSDDTVDKDFHLSLYQTATGESADIVYAPFAYIRGNDRRMDNIKPGKYFSVKDKLSVLSNGAVTNKLFKADLVKDIRFPTGVIYEDNVFLIKAVFRVNCLATINNVCYNYVLKENSLITSRELNEKRAADSLKILQELVEVANAYCTAKSDRSEFINFCIRSFIDNRWQNASFAEKFVCCFESAPEMKKIAARYKNSFANRLFSVRRGSNLVEINFLGIKIKKKIYNNMD